MPKTNCPACGRDIPFPDHFCGTEIACPAAACGRPVQLPNADGTVPVKRVAPPPLPKLPPPDTYYLRRPADPDLVVGPLPRAKLRHMAAKDQLQQIDELSTDGKTWQLAARRDPGLFREEDVARSCPSCGALLKESDDQCGSCAKPDPSDERAAGSYAMSAAVGYHPGKLNPRVERSIAAPGMLADFCSARGADAVVGATTDGWLGLWRAGDGERLRAWEFEPGRRVQVFAAELDARAIVAVEHAKRTRLYLTEFEYRKLNEVAEIDGRVEALALSPDGKHLTLVDDAPEVRVYRVNPWKRLDQFPVRGDRFAIAPVGDRLAAAHQNGAVFLWDLREGEIDRELFGGGEAACRRLPLRMGFSRTGRRLFTATGTIVRFPEKHFDGINPVAAYVLLGVPGLILNNNARLIADAIQPTAADLRARLEHFTAVRVWNIEKGRVTDELDSVIVGHHPTGIADAVFCPSGSAAVTLGQAAAHAWDLSTGHHLGPLYEVADPAEVRRAAANLDPDRAALPGHPTLIRRIDFTRGGEHALVLPCGSRDIRVVRWPT